MIVCGYDEPSKADIEDMARELLALRWLLYRAVKELDYVRSVENCRSGLCASAEGYSIINAGMKLLGMADLSADDYLSAPPPPEHEESK
jgi:hypothetical protein